MLPLTESPATRPSTRLERIILTAALTVGALGLVGACASAQTVPTVSLVAGEIRHGQHGRADGAGIEVTIPAGPLALHVEAMGRHGDVDDNNSGMPWLTLTASRSLTTLGPVHLGAAAGMYSTPMSDYGTWTPLAGPRIDVDAGPYLRLHLSHYWRETGLVRSRMTTWTPRTLFRLDLRLLGRS